MFELANDQLTVTMLHPVQDRERMGARYCAGGYIFQITDHKLGDLLSGPSFPDSFNTFDGQGIPDAFNLSPLRAIGEPSEALIIGVGVCDLSPNYQRNGVKSFDDWQCEIGADRALMVCEHSYQGWGVRLERSVVLSGRTITNEITLINTGQAPIPMRWFPHPFYPHAGDELCKVNLALGDVASEGYELRANGWIARKNWPWTRGGYYLPLDQHAEEKLVIQQRHPKLGMVSATCSYVPDFFPIWGNLNTFSWEPFYERMIAPGTSENWWIDYDF